MYVIHQLAWRRPFQIANMASMRRTHQSEAQRLMQAREAEASQLELEKELKKMRLADAQTALDERTEAKRQIRHDLGRDIRPL